MCSVHSTSTARPAAQLPTRGQLAGSPREQRWVATGSPCPQFYAGRLEGGKALPDGMHSGMHSGLQSDLHGCPSLYKRFPAFQAACFTPLARPLRKNYASVAPWTCVRTARQAVKDRRGAWGAFTFHLETDAVLLRKPMSCCRILRP